MKYLRLDDGGQTHCVPLSENTIRIAKGHNDSRGSIIIDVITSGCIEYYVLSTPKSIRDKDKVFEMFRKRFFDFVTLSQNQDIVFDAKNEIREIEEKINELAMDRG